MRVFDVVGTVLCVPALLVRLQRLINVIWCRRGDSGRAGRATPAGGILADRGRHRGVLVMLGIVLMAASLLFIPMKRSLPLAVVVVAILCVQYGIQSLLKPMLQIETVHMMGPEKVERATALVSQITMASNILGPVVGTAVYGCFGIDALCETAALTFAMSALLFGGALKQNASSGMTGDSTTCSTC